MTNINDLFGESTGIPDVTYLYHGDVGFNEALEALFGEDTDTIEEAIEAILADADEDGEPAGEFLTPDDQDALSVQGLLGVALGGVQAGITYTPEDLFRLAKTYAENYISKEHVIFEQIREYEERFFSETGSV